MQPSLRSVVPMDPGTKLAVSKIPLLTVNAGKLSDLHDFTWVANLFEYDETNQCIFCPLGPRDKERWVDRLKEELKALIQVCISHAPWCGLA